MLKLLITLFVFYGFGRVIAQTEGAKESIKEDVLKPKLAALSVSNLDASSEWYSRVFGFTEISRYNFDADNMRLAFMDNNGFELELIEIKNSVPFNSPDSSNSATRRGIVKLAFYSNAINSLYKTAENEKVLIKSTLRKSNRTGGRFFILLDPDGNWIQVFGP